MANTQRQKLEQGRASFAFSRAVSGYNLHRKEYAQYTKKLSMMIKINGLGATLAFMFSKQKTWGTILKDIEDWLSHPDNRKTQEIYGKVNGERLVQRVLELDSAEYRILTIETLAYLRWLSRFAEGINKEQELKEKNDAKNG